MSKPQAEFSLDSLAAKLSAEFDGPLNICGWSLGRAGSIALGAVCASTGSAAGAGCQHTPCFTERGDWPFGMAAEKLAAICYRTGTGTTPLLCVASGFAAARECKRA